MFLCPRPYQNEADYPITDSCSLRSYRNFIAVRAAARLR
jgi:hypothetical protein